MRSIQITFDERLLAALDATEEVKEKGRSAVMRRAVEEYLERRRRWAIAESYREAYGQSAGVSDEFPGWEDQGEWPDE
jgi:metal-responsive CopG/Arc/MetJ family transcriptional regulator